MARDNVTTLTTPQFKRHSDSSILRAAANWNIARAEAQAHWARGDLETEYGANPGNEQGPPREALDTIDQCEHLLAMFEPNTTLGARVMLEVAASIMAAHKLDPESSFGEGPVLEIIINVAKALACRDMAFPDETAND